MKLLPATVSGFDATDRTLTIRLDALPCVAIGDSVGLKLGKASQPSAAVREMIASFADSFQERYIREYKATKPDEAAAAFLVGCGTPEHVIGTLEKAVARNGYWASKTCTLASLSHRWNDIAAEAGPVEETSTPVKKDFFS